MQLTLTEDQLTYIIKTAFEHYKSKPFGYASFNLKGDGIEVQFHDGGCRHEEPDLAPHNEAHEDLEPTNQMLANLALQNLLGSCGGGSSPGFGGFGGGMSGGAGASGDF